MFISRHQITNKFVSIKINICYFCQKYNIMSQIKLSCAHYFGFLYVAFAHKTDNIYTREEQIAVWKLVKKWSERNLQINEFTQTMDEVMILYKNYILNDDFEENIMYIAKNINDYDWFNDNKKLESSKDLHEIALADNKFLRNEKKWIKKIAEIWEIDIIKVEKNINVSL